MTVNVDMSDFPEGDTYGVIPGLICAFHIHHDGTARPLPIDRPIPISHDGWLWLHLDLVDTRACRWLHTINLPAAAVAVLTAHDCHQQLNATGACFYGVLSDLVRNLGTIGDDFAHLHFAMTDRMLITGRYHALASVDAVRQAIEQGQHTVPSAAALLELIVEHVATAVDRLNEKMMTELDAIEHDLSDGMSSDRRQELGRLRRTSVKLHRQFAALRTLFHRLERDGSEALKPAMRLKAEKIAQRLDAIDHVIVEIRDRARLMQEEIAIAAAEESNRTLRMLTIITTFILPPTLIAGAFGMNLKGMPFSEDAAGFWSAVCVMLLSIAPVYLVIKRIGFFKT